MNNKNNFHSIKQIDSENNKVIHDNSKRNDNNTTNSISEQSNDADIDFAIIQMKELIENLKNIQAMYQDVSIFVTLYNQKIRKISVMYCWSSTT